MNKNDPNNVITLHNANRTPNINSNCFSSFAKHKIKINKTIVFARTICAHEKKKFSVLASLNPNELVKMYFTQEAATRKEIKNKRPNVKGSGR